MEKLTPDELKHIHNEMLKRYGGLPGEKNPGMVDYVCDKPFLISFGHELYPDIFQKAAVLMYSIARGHYFNDGNKRTASMAAYVFLMKNGYELIVSNDNFYDTTIKVAKGDLNEDHLTEWLKDKSHSIDEE